MVATGEVVILDCRAVLLGLPDSIASLYFSFDSAASPCGRGMIDAKETKTVHYLSLAILPVALFSALVR
jgi:hypothetical protein